MSRPSSIEANVLDETVVAYSIHSEPSSKKKRGEDSSMNCLIWWYVCCWREANVRTRLSESSALASQVLSLNTRLSSVNTKP